MRAVFCPILARIPIPKFGWSKAVISSPNGSTPTINVIFSKATMGGLFLPFRISAISRLSARPRLQWTMSAPPFAVNRRWIILCAKASRYFAKPLTRKDIISHYAGLRALYNEGDNFGAGDATRRHPATMFWSWMRAGVRGGAPVISVLLAVKSPHIGDWQRPP